MYERISLKCMGFVLFISCETIVCFAIYTAIKYILICRNVSDR